MTKRSLAWITVAMTAACFAILTVFLNGTIGQGTGNVILFASKMMFLSVTVASVAAFVLIFIFKRDFIRGQAATFNRFKYLLALLVKRDFVSRYRKSVLGVLWSLLNPLLTMLVMTMVFSYLFRFQIEHYPAYLLSGLIIYNFFSEATTMGMGSVIAGEAIIKKVYVPKYIFPLSKVLSSLVNLLFSFIAFLFIYLITGVPFKATLLLFPIPMMYVFVFSLGLAMLLSSFAVFFRDLTYLYGILITLLMYLSAIFYPVDIIPERFQPLMGLNPLYQFVTYFRSLVLDGTVPGLWTNTVCTGFALAALCVGVYVFMSKQDRFILYL